MNSSALNIHFDPLLPDAWLIAILLIGAFIAGFSLWKVKGGFILRVSTFIVFVLALLNPSLLEEERQGVSDVAVIVIDQSPSQKMGQREERTQTALQSLKDKLEKQDNLELRIIEAPKEGLANETRLFSDLERTLADVPQGRRAGVIFLTDGQIHDAPKNSELFEQYGPVHTLLSGDKNEKDRQLVILQAPSYGIVGQKISLKYKIEDTNNINQSIATLTLTQPGSLPKVLIAPTNEEQILELPIDHAGQNVFELTVESTPGEITESNNRTALIVNGVRDRLRVLLVSGQPHSGGRAWRDLLTSDPGVDLVHFTILREPDKLDATPQKELSLIAFPFRELFEIKLYDFDLIVFDRYRLNRILPENYFKNIVRYVEEGGAFLEASGPSFAGQDSVYFTSLMNVLPGTPTGNVIRKPFYPTVTNDGNKHPVTKNLFWKANTEKGERWGQWLRQVAITRESGDILMSGADDHPLLILDRVGEGRVAQIASDHLWLWARGYEGGGPHTELLRRVVHWLMKEPSLDEKALDVKVNGTRITVSSQNHKSKTSDIMMSKPDDETETITLEPTQDGRLEKIIKADQLGIYGFEDNIGQKRFAVVGDLNPQELRGVKTTPDILAPLVNASGGGTLWLADTPTPSVQMMTSKKNYAGRNWIGLRRNNDYTVTGVKDRPVLPEWLSALIILALVTFIWWREGRSL